MSGISVHTTYRSAWSSVAYLCTVSRSSITAGGDRNVYGSEVRVDAGTQLSLRVIVS